MEYDTEKVHIDNIRVGGIVLHNGHFRTVCANNIGNDALMGSSLWGDSYHSGHKTVLRALHPLTGKPLG